MFTYYVFITFKNDDEYYKIWLHNLGHISGAILYAHDLYVPD
jgi:hypothetical protein